LRHLGSNENDAVGGSLAGKRVAALGQAFKPNSDDVRDSPSLDVCGRLAAEGAIVSAHDPVALQNASRLRPDLRYAKSVLEAVRAWEAAGWTVRTVGRSANLRDAAAS